MSLIIGDTEIKTVKVIKNGIETELNVVNVNKDGVLTMVFSKSSKIIAILQINVSASRTKKAVATVTYYYTNETFKIKLISDQTEETKNILENVSVKCIATCSKATKTSTATITQINNEYSVKPAELTQTTATGNGTVTIKAEVTIGLFTETVTLTSYGSTATGSKTGAYTSEEMEFTEATE